MFGSPDWLEFDPMINVRPQQNRNQIAGDNDYGETAASLDRYFLPFAVAARREAGYA
ncbi:MAG: hypothetical protein ACLGIJ_05610 [Candidatus Limnocylindria bacterium]